jgi:hypothetical protein
MTVEGFKWLVKLPPIQQEEVAASNPEGFLPVKGSWGARESPL